MKENEMQFMPWAQVIRFPQQDIVTTSGQGDTPVGGGSGVVLPDDTWPQPEV